MAPEEVRILVVDDERELRRMLATALAGYGYLVEEAPSGSEGLSRTQLFHPHMIILDLGLPDMDGIEVIRRLREWTKVPIIVLTVREHEEDKINALDAGADDYVTKPFGMGELMARIRVALRYSGGPEETVIVWGRLTIDLAARRVAIDEKGIKLTLIEYEVLKYLVLQAGRVVTHRQLLRAIRGPGHVGDAHYLRVYIAQLRHKLEEDPNRPRYIVTEPGVGYRFGALDNEPLGP